MSESTVQVDDEKARFTCDNCDWEGAFDEVEPLISDIEDRINAGCLVPAGVCPECRALAYYTDETAPSWTAQGELHKLRAELAALKLKVAA